MDNDAKRAVVGLLMAAVDDARQGQLDLIDAVMFPDGKLPGVIRPYNTSVGLPADLVQQGVWDLIRMQLEAAEAHLTEQAYGAIFYMVALFGLLAREADKHGTDVDAFLQREAMNLW